MGAPNRNRFRVGPPVLWRISRIFLALAVASFLLAVALTVWRYTFAKSRPAWQRHVIVALGVMPSLVLYPISSYLQRRVRRDWHESGGLLCMHCAYRLIGLPPRGRCPECGATYDVDADSQHWRDIGLERPSPKAAETPEAPNKPAQS